ncbi:MAG: helix-turn-helix domain-containing protein [Clostridiales bacterium]|nr:helix-turn-helix domain-containing protein [Clostridiales bacterium]
MTTGRRMKERRKQLGIPVDEIASALNVSIATVYRYENGDIEKVPGSVLEPLAKVLQTTPAWLMGWSEQICDEPDAASAEKEKSDPARSDFCPSAQDWEQAISKMSKDELKALMDAAMEKFMDK